MALSFGFFIDPALTTRLTSSLQFIQDKTSPAAEDKVVYFGSSRVDRVCRDSAAPLVDAIVLSAVVTGAGNVFMATSSAGLDTAVAGAALDLGVEVAGGVDNAIPVHLRVLDVSHAVGQRAVAFSTNTLSEYAA